MEFKTNWHNLKHLAQQYSYQVTYTSWFAFIMIVKNEETLINGHSKEEPEET